VDLPSEGTMRGAIQVPPSGEPIVFLADHPVTGGYPVIGVVTDADIDLVGQTLPGDELRLAPVH
ncbi:allophanate hydrolase subunit 2 family protein, partial [Streptomyces albiflaviniger]|nr:allophanate hydrolase subunit 2 family protein [Streptomyces albiflaviniger]